MPGFYGTSRQQELQARVENDAQWIAQTPGACNPGRFLGTDDPGRLGWDKIFETLDRDGTFSFQLVRSDELDCITSKLAECQYRIDLWDVFVATRSEAELAVSSILEGGLSTEFRVMPASEICKPATVLNIQSFLATNGIAPFSVSMLLGEHGPATTVAISNEAGELSAVAHGYFPHNVHSPHHLNAWGGLVAVSPDQRGKRLGKFVNAQLIANCMSDLGAEFVHQFVASSNVPSRRMVESSGLRLDPSLLCGLAVKGGERFTR
ncbi:MAG: GNAT family N-acetyltransferase [Hyphomicrobiaceae bacterium]